MERWMYRSHFFICKPFMIITVYCLQGYLSKPTSSAHSGSCLHYWGVFHSSWYPKYAVSFFACWHLERWPYWWQEIHCTFIKRILTEDFFWAFSSREQKSNNVPETLAWTCLNLTELVGPSLWTATDYAKAGSFKDRYSNCFIWFPWGP